MPRHDHRGHGCLGLLSNYDGVRITKGEVHRYTMNRKGVDDVSLGDVYFFL